MTLDDALNQMLTCVPVAGCKHEAACFLVARTLHRHRRDQSVSNEPEPELVVKQPEALPDLEVAHYAPTWESHRPPAPIIPPIIDWSAA